MADVLQPALGPAAERGTLEVRTKALQHVVERATLDVPGTVTQHRTLGGVLGSGAPRASVSVRGGRARIDVTVACGWPAPVARIAADVRTRVTEQATALTGVQVLSVDVTVQAASDAAAADRQDRRVE
ncbi:Asp23/Gls24 family envelope stress response protein [Nocardioides anomalus]|uniref:Asp23/Gls24 family envelope stress response protein n=1 Tax=Nocardioides anomalus TaxID=2712223 RepID=A0A6G6W9Z2_9ACTN|nr:Asp23/Gls24 family envelope stress response protein [Nocardioides anomalus]QIG42158.1 Asp23/Gls24 family envelope stress response protein [Nocardioides anomalus]